MTTKFNATADKSKSEKAAWDKAPAGSKKDSALGQSQAAEKGQSAKNSAEPLTRIGSITLA